MSRLFIGIWPPDDVLDDLAELPQPRDQGVRWIERERRHITLRFLADADAEAVAAALDAVQLPRCTARLGPALDLLGEHSLVIPVDGLDDLADVVRRSTARLLDRPDRRRFFGHLTVAKLRRRARPRRSAGLRIETRFDVHEVALVHSTLHPDGAMYETLATWPTR